MTRELSEKFDRYPQRVPRTEYVAQRCFDNGHWVMTDIAHVGDDPLYQPATEPSHPHLAPAQREALNAPHGRTYRMRQSVARECVIDDRIMWDRHFATKRREAVFLAAFEGRVYEDQSGGFVPYDGTPIEGTWGEIVNDRLKAKAAGDYVTADLIKKAMAGGSTELLDTNSGTMYFFA